MKKYNLLDKTKEENVEELREYAEAKTEWLELSKRVDFLDSILAENHEMRSAVWTTQEGLCKPIPDLDDDHLKNIVTHLRSQGATNSRISKEYQKRFGEDANLKEDAEDWEL